MEIIWFMIGFFIFITMLFMVIAVFFPEWVGITGKKAHEIMEDHKGVDEAGNPIEPKVKDPKI